MMTTEVAHATIPVNEPLIGAREAAYVADCMRSGWISIRRTAHA